MDAQRAKTSGLNPNPIEPARCKRSLPFPTKTQHIVEHVSICGTIFGYVSYLFQAFFLKVAKGVQGPATKW